MSNHYLQWLTGQRRGEVESAEMMQDGQTFEDVVILSNGRKVPMAQVGKDFIILPSASAALNSIDLEVMYPKPSVKTNRVAQKQKRLQQEALPADHASIMGLDAPSEEEPKRERPTQKKASSFASDLLSRAKKNETMLSLELLVQMPTDAFFRMLQDTFDDATIGEIIDILVDSVDIDQIKTTMKETIIKYYGEDK